MTIYITSYKVQIPPISIPLFLVKLLQQLTKTNRHLYAKVLLQTLWCLILKFLLIILLLKKTSKHINLHINTSKLKCDSNDTLHLSKTDELEAKFDALKSLVTRGISNLANKLESVSLVLNQTSKALEKRGVNNSKLLLDDFEFLRLEILSKDKLINYLMGKQTTILND